MPTEIYPHPTVKEVDFEIRYPILFSIENKIGDFQQMIINQFPEAQQLFERNLVFANVGPEGKVDNVPEEGSNLTRKLWVFKSGTGHEVRISTNTLVIVSTNHKTYNNPGDSIRFRDVIEFVTGNFFKLFTVPLIRRIGLRYIDECPLPIKNNDTLVRLYDSSFPYERFPIGDTKRIYFEITTKKGSHNLIYREALIEANNQNKIILDFDGFEEQVPSADLLRITDELHQMIDNEYFSIIKEPIKIYMRTGQLE